MLNRFSKSGCVVVLLMMVVVTGCASRERALVTFSYVVEPERGLPPGMKTIAIQPAKVGAATDEKWSQMCATILQSLINESRNRFGTPITVSDRRDTQVTFDEADLAASGMSTRAGGSGGKLLAVDGIILSKIDVKVEKHIGKQRTLAGLSLAGFGGHGWGGGSTDIRTEEVETVTRSMTVQTDFRLIDTADNRVWEQHSPRPFQSTDRTKASPIFGSSSTEADLTPQDAIIATLVDKAAREFVSRLMPCRIEVDAEVVSSGNANCVQGVRMLRAEAFRDAVAFFEAAMREDSNDHQAAFGAGIASEASGQYDAALSFYKRACAGRASADYREARDRMKTYGSRVRP